MQLSTPVLFAFLLVAPAFVITQNSTDTVITEATTVTPDGSAVITTTSTPEATTTTATETSAAPDNGTDVDNGNTTTTMETTTTAPPSTQPPVPAPMVPKGVTQVCLDHYHGCINESALDDMNDKKYCDAFTKAKMCISGQNQTAQSNACTTEEQNRLEFLDCGLENLLNLAGNATSVALQAACVSRVTECLSQATEAKNIKDASSFKTQLCKVADNSETCFKTEDGGSVCTEDEYKSILDTAECSSGTVLLSSALLVALAYLVQCAVNGF